MRILNKITYCATVLSFLAASMVSGQKIYVSPERSMRNDDGYAIIGKIENEYLLFIDTQDKYELEAFDPEMQQRSKKIVQLNHKHADILDVTGFEDNFTVVYQYTKRSRAYTIISKFDAQGEALQTDTLEITAFNRHRLVENHVLSENKQYFMFYDIDINDRLSTNVYDLKAMKMLWRKDFMIKNLDTEREFLKSIVDNQGNAHFVLTKDNRKIRRITNRFSVISYQHATETFSETIVPISDYLWEDIDFKFDNRNQRIIGVGLYYDKKLNEPQGYFYINSNLRDSTQQVVHFQSFTPNFIAKVTGKTNPKNRGIPDMRINRLLLRNDGGVLLIAERNRFYYRNISTLGPVTNQNVDFAPKTDFHFDDILLFSIDPTGKLFWTEILQKRQFSQDDGGRFSSFLLLEAPNELRFLYNDEIRHNTVINDYIISPTGVSDRNSVYNSEADKVTLLLREGLQISNKEALIASERNNAFKLLRLVYP